MKQHHRLILFIILSMGLFFAWINIGPLWFPNLFFPKGGGPQKKEPVVNKRDGKKLTPAEERDWLAPWFAAEPPKLRNPQDGWPVTWINDWFADHPDKIAKTPNGKKPGKKQPPKKPPVDPVKIVRHPPRKVLLGSLDPESGYFLQAELHSRGAAIEFIKLNDERFRTLKDENEQLKIVGSTDSKFRTFETTVKDVDALLKQKTGLTLRNIDWKLDDKATVIKDKITTNVTFTYEFDGLRFSKRYWLEKLDLSDTDLKTAQETESKGYELRFQFKVENLGNVARSLTYKLQGPIGVPLENPEIARMHRRLISGIDVDGSLTSGATTAADVIDEGTDLKGSVRYVGIDVQYFAAMIIPGGDQKESPYIDSAQAEVIERAANEKHSDISVLLTSKELTLGASGDKGASVSHDYTLFTGPKRKELLEPYAATDLIDYGWLGNLFGFIARGMLWLLNFFNGLGAPYWLAIILMTACVRGALFPLSRKQAKSANKMKELQPKIAELKKKYGEDREKLAKAQMELFAKHGYNPLAGCLPILLQLPIFIGLYQSLSNAVELRLAEFLWIKNLAAPDALFEFGFRIPLVGWTTFNILPLITIVLFIAQQKMFMPPATDEQTAMQQKMMMYMSIFFGFLFYTVPSGLCLYFIASSLWGMGERKLLGTSSKEPPKPDDAGGADDGGDTKTPAPPEPDKPKGFFGKLLEMADDAAAAKARANGDNGADRGTRKKSPAGGGSGKRKKGRKRR